MKKTLLLLLIICNIAAYTQINKTLLRQATFRGLARNFSYAGNTLYMAAYNLSVESFILKSTDQGTTWQKTASQPWKSSDNLDAIYFISATTGWVGGANGRIFKTTDAGASWVEQTDTIVYKGAFNCIYFFDAQNGYASGGNSNGTSIIKTTNGGLTWKALTHPTTSTYYDMYWFDQSSGIIVGSSSNYLITTDGGATWTNKTVPIAASTLYRIKKGDDLTFYIIGTAGRIFKSTDAGFTFTALSSPTTTTLYTAEFADAQKGIVLGSNGAAYSTTNGGVNWTAIPSFTTEVIKASIKAGSRIVCGAYTSNLFYTTDMGASWVSVANSMRDFYGIQVEDANNIIIAGDRGEVNITSDGGTTWKKSNFSSGNLYYDVAKFGNTIHVCGQNGAYFISNDLGNTWIDRSTPGSTVRNYKMWFLDKNNGYLANNAGNISYTTDGGSTWTIQASFPSTILYDLKMFSPTRGFAMGSGSRIFETKDGKTWQHGDLVAPVGQMTSVYMLDDQKGYACGQYGAVYKTTDGFKTVTLMTDTAALSSKVIWDVFAFDENNVWAISAGGLILRNNSLNTMTVVDTAFWKEDLYNIAKIDNNSFVFAGGTGSVYKISFTAIPVELTSFTAAGKDNSIILKWQTATETNNLGFSVERRTNKTDWQSIGFVKGNGTSAQIHNYGFTDSKLNSGTVYYRLKQIDLDGKFTYSNIVEAGISLPQKFVLSQNFPNPFNPSTVIKYSIPVSGHVSLQVFDVLGRLVETLVDETKSAGEYSLEFKTNLSSGVYYYTLKSGSFTETKKMTVIK